MDFRDDGITKESMRLKVLYTFDADNKNNCLARWPHVLEIKTAFVDESTKIGLIDLKTCIQAITSSSPELIAKLDNDFTIYAYDYSEPDTPLVGQGLMSWALSTKQEMADLDNSPGSFVTGRVIRGGMGLFSRSLQETLEVKLRLAPVPSSTQSDYLNSLQKYKEASGVIGQNFDAQSWTNFVQNNPGFLSVPARQPSDRPASPMDRNGLDAVQRMLSGGASRREFSNFPDTFPAQSNSRPASRCGTPMSAQPYIPPQQQQAPASRPSSRSGALAQKSHQRRDSFNSGYYSAEEVFEEGPAKKRAKVTRVDWPSRSDLNIERQPESLRVAASTASSVRLHRPVPVNMVLPLQSCLSNEEPVRPPTPVPKSVDVVNRLQRTTSSNLRLASDVRPSPMQIVDQAQQRPPANTIWAASPEDPRPGSIVSTPIDMPSSPPVMMNSTSFHSSPVLPPLPADHDSGFMSSNFDDIFGEAVSLNFDAFVNEKVDTDLLNKSNETANISNAPVPAQANDRQHSQPSELPHPSAPTLPFDLPPPPAPMQPAELPPPPATTQPFVPIAPAPNRAQTSRPARIGMSSPRLAPAPVPRARQIEEEMRALSALSQPVASDPMVRTMHRSTTWTGDMSDVPASDGAVGDEVKRRTGPKKRVGKEQTKARLEAAIAAGDMPPFCENCGAIETPAWRRAYSRVFTEGYDELDTSSLEEGACVFKQVLERNEDGTVKRFRGFKICKKAGDSEDEWLAITLCNPCGLWFNKQKCMRPPEKYNKKDPNEKGRRRGRPRGSKTETRTVSGSTQSDAPTPASDGSSPDDTATDAVEAAEGEGAKNDETQDNRDVTSHEPELPLMSKRAASAEPQPLGLSNSVTRSLRNRQQRMIQSSPAKSHGSKVQPIEIDLTPKPLRRKLFSPSKPQDMQHSPNHTVKGSAPPLSTLPNFVRRSPRINRARQTGAFEAPLGASTNKENVGPASTLGDGLDDLFDDDGDESRAPPLTPTPQRRSDRLTFKTPSKSAGLDLISPTGTRANAKLGTPKAQGSLHPAAAAMLDHHGNVADMTPFTRQIHQILSDVPQINPDDLDFPELPSLNNSSPSYRLDFNFSELTTEQLNTETANHASTDAPMPSSPPAGFYNFDNTHDDGTGSFWENLNRMGGEGDVFMDDSAANTGPAGSVGLEVNAQAPRRSPRKR